MKGNNTKLIAKQPFCPTPVEVKVGQLNPSTRCPGLRAVLFLCMVEYRVAHVVVIVRLPVPSGFSGEKASVTSSLRKITWKSIRCVSGTEGLYDTEQETSGAAESKESRQERVLNLY